MRKSKSLQHLVFPGGPPIQVLTRPDLLSFRDRTRSGVLRWYGRKRIQRSNAGYLKKTHRGCISERLKKKQGFHAWFYRNQIKVQEITTNYLNIHLNKSIQVLSCGDALWVEVNGRLYFWTISKPKCHTWLI